MIPPGARVVELRPEFGCMSWNTRTRNDYKGVGLADAIGLRYCLVCRNVIYDGQHNGTIELLLLPQAMSSECGIVPPKT